MKTFDLLDTVDWTLLRALQQDARFAYQSLAQKVGLTGPAVVHRMKELERAGIIVNYRAEVNPKKLGLQITAYIRLAENVRNVVSLIDLIKKSPEVFECHRGAGADNSFILKVHVRTFANLEALVNRFTPYGSVDTMVVSSSPVRKRSFTKSLLGSLQRELSGQPEKRATANAETTGARRTQKNGTKKQQE